MKRRDFITLLGGATAGWPLAALAQQATRIPRLASLSGGSPAGTKERDACFEAELRKLGWIEGQNIAIERRWASGNIARLPALASELLAQKPDLIMTSGTPSAQAMHQSTRQVPVVFNMVSDPIASGLVTNLARPNENITGVSNFFPAMIGKLLELIKTVSGAVRFAVVCDLRNPGKQADIRGLQENAHVLGVELEPMPVRNIADVNAAFAAMTQRPPGALIVLVDSVTLSNMQGIVEQAAKLRTPAIYQERAFVELGGLMSYALNYCAHMARAATYVDKILRGEKLSNLPVEQPSSFELVINLKTAKALGLTVPTSVIAVADQVIE